MSRSTLNSTPLAFPKSKYTNIDSIIQYEPLQGVCPCYSIELIEEPYPNTYFSFLCCLESEELNPLELHPIEQDEGYGASSGRLPSSDKKTSYFQLQIGPVNNQPGLYKNGYGVFVANVAQSSEESISDSASSPRESAPFDIARAQPEEYRYLDATIRYKDDTLLVTSHEPLRPNEYWHIAFSVPYYEETWERDLVQFGAYRFLKHPRKDGTHSSSGARGRSASASSEHSPLDFGQIIGYSLENRALRTYSIGSGSTTVFCTARVHPGETASSGLMRGLLRIVSHPTDPRSQLLRSHFKFVFLPFVNPDGVHASRYRTNPNGENLNRCFKETDPALHPEIHAIKKYFAHLYDNENLTYYIDMHAHAKTRGCFIYGNHMTKAHHVDNVLFARLLALNSQHFTFQGCNFSKKGMQNDKSNTGRVTLYREHHSDDKPVYCFTIEINYCTGVSLNKLPDLHEPSNDILRVLNVNIPSALRRMPSAPLDKWERYLCEQPAGEKCPQIPRFTTVHYEDVGHAMGVSLLDLIGKNPFSRVPQSRFKTLSGVRTNVQQHISMKSKIGKKRK